LKEKVQTLNQNKEGIDSQNESSRSQEMNNLYMKMSEEGLFSDDFSYKRDANVIDSKSNNKIVVPHKSAFMQLSD
jgi:hypothetical protein